MFKFNLFVLACMALLALCCSCNPDCPSIPGLNISASINTPGSEVLISANPPSALENKQVFFGDIEAETQFVEDLGLIATVPENTAEATEVRIEDGDCVDFANFGFTVVDEAFFVNNPQFVSPFPPNIVIPTIPPSFPPVLDQAWISPQNPDYCLWFVMVKDSILAGGPFADCVVDTGENPYTVSTTLDPFCSKELSTCGSGTLYQDNPISGTIDRDRNYIHIWIDRGGLGIEEYVGQFIDIEQTNYTAPVTLECNGAQLMNTGHMMLLQSLSTGRQTIAFQLVL